MWSAVPHCLPYVFLNHITEAPGTSQHLVIWEGLRPGGFKSNRKENTRRGPKYYFILILFVVDSFSRITVSYPTNQYKLYQPEIKDTVKKNNMGTVSWSGCPIKSNMSAIKTSMNNKYELLKPFSVSGLYGSCFWQPSIWTTCEHQYYCHFTLFQHQNISIYKLINTLPFGTDKTIHFCHIFFHASLLNVSIVYGTLIISTE